MNNALILLAGGTGTRANSNTPKQFVEVNKTAIFIYSIILFLSFVEFIVIVVHNDYVDFAKEAIKEANISKKVFFARGGNTGLDSAKSSNYSFSASQLAESVFDSNNGVVKKKDGLFKIMSPHCFKSSFLKKLLEQNRFSNELTIFNIMISQKYPVVISKTTENNFKITTQQDLEIAICLLAFYNKQ